MSIQGNYKGNNIQNTQPLNSNTLQGQTHDGKKIKENLSNSIDKIVQKSSNLSANFADTTKQQKNRKIEQNSISPWNGVKNFFNHLFNKKTENAGPKEPMPDLVGQFRERNGMVNYHKNIQKDG